MTKRPEDRIVYGGRFYGRVTPDGPLVPADPAAIRRPDAWVCRRIADYPGGTLPAGAAPGTCVRCDAGIAFNPARAILPEMAGVPHVCMQCADIEPLPIDPPV